MTDANQPTTPPTDQCSRFIPIVAVRPMRRDQLEVFVDLLVELLLEVPEPFSCTYVVDWNGGERIDVGFKIDAPTAELTEHGVDTARQAVGALLPFLEIGTDTVPPAELESPETVHFDAAPPEATRRKFVERPLFWGRSYLGLGGQRLEITPRSLIRPEASVTDQATGENTELLVDVDLVMKGDPESVWTAANLLSTEHRVATRLVPTQTKPETHSRMPLSTIAGLIASPLMHEQAWSTAKQKTTEELARSLGEAQPPHAAFTGGSGLGKSVLTVNLASNAIQRGRTVILIDRHRGASSELASVAKIEGLEVDAYDFADADPPRLPLTVPPTGVTPREHAYRTSEVLQDIVWADMPDSYFGPVGKRNVLTALSILTEDPGGPWTAERFAQIFDPDDEFARNALKRIDDETLTRSYLREILPMLRARDVDNNIVWLTSKIGPLVDDPTIKPILASTISTFDLERCFSMGRSAILSIPETSLSATGASLIGALTLERLWDLAMRFGPNLETPIELFVDEWQLLPKRTIQRFLAEGRKFNIHLRLVNQSLRQLEPNTAELVMANCGWLGTFRTGARDAAQLDQRYPTISAGELQRLRKHEIAVSTGDADYTTLTPAPLANSLDTQALCRLHAITQRALKQQRETVTRRSGTEPIDSSPGSLLPQR